MSNKQSVIRLELNSRFDKTLNTEFVAWSRDKESYKFLFEFGDGCGNPLILEDAKPRILLEFNDGIKQIYSLDIDSKHLGLATFTLPSRILGYDGFVKASVYVDYEKREHDLGNFRFKMKKSHLDCEMPELQFYVSEFDEGLKKWEEKQKEVTEITDVLDGRIEKIETKIIENDLVTHPEAGDFDSFRADDFSIIEKMNNEFSERSINISWFGVDLTGKTDSTDAMNKMVDYVNSIKNYVPTVLFTRGEVQFKDTLHFKREVFLKSDGNCWINYTGESEAIIFGPDGITYDTYTNFRHFNADGLKFKKSEKAKHAIRVNRFVTQPKITNCDFRDFGKHLSWSIYFEEEVWFGLVSNCRFDNGRNQVARQFVYSVPFGNNQIFIINCLVHSLSGIGDGIFLNGVASKVIDCKIEGFSTNIIIGSQADYSSVENTSFEKSGNNNTGCIELGEKDKNISKRGPRGVRIIGNYANIHLLADKPVSRFIKVANDEVVIRDLIVEQNSVNDWNEQSVSGIIIELNNIPGNDNNYANNNIVLGTSKISNLLTNSNNLMGNDSNRNIKSPKMQADILERIITPTGIARFDVLSSSGEAQIAFISAPDKSATFYVNDILGIRFHNDGRISFGKSTVEEKYDFNGTIRAKTIKMSEKKDKGGAGEMFEGQDGNLYYVNLQGQTKKITN